MNNKTLPQKTFNFSFTSEIDGETYQGIFVVRRKVIADEPKIRVRQTQLNGGFHYDPESPGVGIDPNTNFLNYMIAYLEVLVVQAPGWFDLTNLYDANLVAALHKEVRDFQNSFRKPTVSVADGSSQGGSQKAETRADESGSTQNMVFSQISTSLEPR